jgi:heptosyltransferase-2
MKRILVIRGGAIGDFILTLPALKLLRKNFPESHLEILGYKHIVALAEGRYYANATRSIEYAPLSRFFVHGAELPPDLVEYFASFDFIISYLFDPDEIFENNLRRAGAQRIVRGPAKLDKSTHAARQLARPLTELGIEILDLSAKIFSSTQDREFAREFIGGLPRPIIAIHPGSGSEQKNWPLQNWVELGNQLLGSKGSRSGGFLAAGSSNRRFGKRRSLIVVSGEADERQTAQLRSKWKDRAVRFATDLSLPYLAALLEKAVFLGHDSGISHLAAAAGARCVLLYGPTDPAIWAPANADVIIIRAPNHDLRALPLDTVRDALANVGAALAPRQ